MTPTRRCWRLFLWLVPALLLAGRALLPAQNAAKNLPPAATVKVKFAKHIYPILSAHCFECHRGLSASAGYRLDLREEILGETNGKPMVKIGNSAASKLIQVVTGNVPGK